MVLRTAEDVYQAMTDPYYYFRDMPTEEVHERVAQRWDVSGRFPLPRFALCCPACGQLEVIYSQCYFHDRKDSPSQHRVDVQCKCTICSHAFVFGVVIPGRMARAATKMQYNRREIRQILQKATDKKNQAVAASGLPVCAIRVCYP